MLSNAQIEQYLRRINFQDTICGSQETLKELQRLHYTHIPYENLDILNQIDLSIDPNSLFKKIISDKRGGCCFELNGLFYELLISLGFEVTNHYARFLFNREDTIPARSHRVLKISCNNHTYIADVGVYSESSRIPLELKEDVIQFDGISQYRFQRDSDFGWILLQKCGNNEWTRFYSFTEEIYFPCDFKQCSFFYEKSLESRFNKKTLIAIKTRKGRKAIKDMELTIIENGKTVISILDKKDLRKILSQHFNLMAM